MSGDTLPVAPPSAPEVAARLQAYFRNVWERTDRFFARLLVVEWAVAVGVALFLSPRLWAGHGAVHRWPALGLGAVVIALPVWSGLRRPGEPLTRHLLVTAQMLYSCLLIYLTAGRVETSFHIFASLAIIAFYRDLRVLLVATLVTFADHLLLGLFFPEAVYGTVASPVWRSLEHTFWVLFEVVFLWFAVRSNLRDAAGVATRQLTLEAMNGEREHEIAERTRLLGQSEERFRALFEESPVGLYRATADGTILLANPTLLQMLGYGSRQELRQAGVRLQGGAEEAEHRAFLAEAAAKGQVQGRDAVWKKRDGTIVFVRESLRVLRNPRGEISFIDGSVEDVTERRKLEERYLQAQKVQAVGQLAGGVAHDFNNIVTAILGYADFLLEEPDLPPQSRKYVGEIQQAGERGAGLTRQLLAFSRKQALQPRVVSLNVVVGEMDAMLRRLVGEHIAVRTHLDPELGSVKVDPGQFQQVVMNLAVNARDAMPDGGKLTIETQNVTLDADYARAHPEAAPGEYVVLAVSDTGTGIPADVRSRLFEPFFTTKEEGKGTGLGLATCHGIVRQSGGHISLYSEVGIGSTFRVYIPRSAEAVPHPVSVPVPARLGGVRGGSETILFVEDDPIVRQVGVLALTSLGYRVIEASHGTEALKKLAEARREGAAENAPSARPALLVTDVVMPEMGGPELARRMREAGSALPVLYTSGYTHEAIARTTLLAEDGASFLGKPYSLALLAERVRQMLDKAPDKTPQAPAPVS